MDRPQIFQENEEKGTKFGGGGGETFQLEIRESRKWFVEEKNSNTHCHDSRHRFSRENTVGKVARFRNLKDIAQVRNITREQRRHKTKSP